MAIQTLHNLIVAPGSKYTVKVNATDFNNDPLKYKWELYHESNDLKTGGDKENKPPLINGRIKKLNSNEIVFKTPANEGRYRLFVFVDDKHKVAYLNIPFYVDGNLDMSKKIHFKQKALNNLNIKILFFSFFILNGFLVPVHFSTDYFQPNKWWASAKRIQKRTFEYFYKWILQIFRCIQ